MVIQRFETIWGEKVPDSIWYVNSWIIINSILWHHRDARWINFSASVLPIHPHGSVFYMKSFHCCVLWSGWNPSVWKNNGRIICHYRLNRLNLLYNKASARCPPRCNFLFKKRKRLPASEGRFIEIRTLHVPSNLLIKCISDGSGYPTRL